MWEWKKKLEDTNPIADPQVTQGQRGEILFHSLMYTEQISNTYEEMGPFADRFVQWVVPNAYQSCLDISGIRTLGQIHSKSLSWSSSFLTESACILWKTLLWGARCSSPKDPSSFKACAVACASQACQAHSLGARSAFLKCFFSRCSSNLCDSHWAAIKMSCSHGTNVPWHFSILTIWEYIFSF